jgi:hypothetical protein
MDIANGESVQDGEVEALELVAPDQNTETEDGTTSVADRLESGYGVSFLPHHLKNENDSELHETNVRPLTNTVTDATEMQRDTHAYNDYSTSLRSGVTENQEGGDDSAQLGIKSGDFPLESSPSLRSQARYVGLVSTSTFSGTFSGYVRSKVNLCRTTRCCRTQDAVL